MLNQTTFFRVLITTSLLIPSTVKNSTKRENRGFRMRKRPGPRSKKENTSCPPSSGIFFECLFPWWKPVMGTWKTAITNWVKQETTYFTSDPKHCLNLPMTKTKLIPTFINSANNIITRIKLLHNKIWHKSTQQMLADLI